MSDEDCLEDLVRSRDRVAISAISALESLVKRQRMISLEEEIIRVQRSIEASLKEFIDHPMITKFKDQTQPHKYGVESRLKSLLFVGDSQQGKSNKGMSIYGVRYTLKVNCSGLPAGVLPSLAKFDRAKHKAIFWDEIRPVQVLNNREIFQSNQFEQVMSQSICNQHSYAVWLYFIPMILSTNEFDMDHKDLSDADSDWLRKNMLVASLAPDQKWFLDS